ncbi:16568_t:CDS:2, partial [Dentiscutata erythropus]
QTVDYTVRPLNHSKQKRFTHLTDRAFQLKVELKNKTNSTKKTSLQVNPFQMMRFNGNDEYKQSEFTNKAGVGDDECENGDNPIIRSYSSRPSTPKKSSPPTPSRTRRHSLISDEKHNLSSPPKGVAYTPNKIVTPADAAAVLAASLAPKDNFINYDNRKLHYQSHPYKYNNEEKSKRQLRRSSSFNHSNPHQTSTNQVIDVAEVLSTAVSFVRENNRKLDRLSDEVRSDGQSSENDMDSDDSDSWQHSSRSRREIENEISKLATQLESMKQKYEDQIRGKNRLIEELEYSLKKSEKDGKKKRSEIERLENQLEAQRRAIDELVEQQNLLTRNQSPNPEQVEALRHLEQELDDKNKTIVDLEKKIQVTSAHHISESKEKERKLDLISNQLFKYKTLETQWDDKQKTLDSLTSQLEVLKKKEVELNEKDSLIESLNIRLDTSQKVIAELREKHAPHDLLRQLRQKDYIIDHLNQRVEDIDADMKDRDDQIEALATCLAEEKKQNERLEEVVLEIDPLKKRVEEMENSNGNLQQQITQKEKMLADLENKYKEALKTCSDSSDKLKNQEQNINSLRQELTQLKQEARDKGIYITTLENETAHMRSNYQRLINALTEKDQRIAYFEQNLENLKNQQNVAKSESQEKESKINKNEVRLNALQKVLNTKIEACRDYEKKISELEKDLDSLRKQMEDSKTSSSEKEIKITKLVKMNRQLKDEVAVLKEKMEEKEQELITIKSKIPQPVPGKSSASSVRSSTSSKPKSRVSSMYSVSGGESSSDETANGSRIRKHASLSGIESPVLKKKTTIDPSKRLSDIPRTSLTRTRSSPSSSTVSSVRSATITLPKSLPKSRMSSTPNSTIEALKKKRDATITPKKEPSPINRSAVTQRKRDMVVLNHMLSGVAPQKRPNTDSKAVKKKSTDSVSSDSERETTKTGPAKKRSSDLATIMEKIREDSTKKGTKAKVTRPTIDTKTPKSPVKTRTPLTRPLPSKKE